MTDSTLPWELGGAAFILLAAVIFVLWSEKPKKL